MAMRTVRSSIAFSSPSSPLAVAPGFDSPGRYAALCRGQCCGELHAGLEPLDLPPESRHLDMMYAQLTLSDKGWHPCWLNSRERAASALRQWKVLDEKRRELGMDGMDAK